MFDTFMGLPLHVLVLHFTVVLVPISAIATAAVFMSRRWCEAYAGRLVVVNLAMLALTFVTVRAGLALQDRYRGIGDNTVPHNDHEELGKILLWIMVALAAATVVAWLATRRAEIPEPAGLSLGMVIASLAVASIVVTILAGHTGSKSHWEDFVKNTAGRSTQ